MTVIDHHRFRANHFRDMRMITKGEDAMIGVYSLRRRVGIWAGLGVTAWFTLAAVVDAAWMTLG